MPHVAEDLTSPGLLRACIAVGIVMLVLMEVQACGDPAARRGLTPTVRPAFLLWQVDLDAPEGPTGTLEAITPIRMNGREAWRVTHYPTDPAASNVNEFDLYDVDGETLRPIRSVMQTPEFRLEIAFGSDEATLRRTTKNGETIERIPLASAVMPEGPGGTVFVASLPLKEGFSRQYSMLDRWDGNGSSRVKSVQLSVKGTTRMKVLAGTSDVFEVEIRAADGSFTIVSYVRTEPPYYPWRMLYTRGSKRMVSEVVAMGVEGVKQGE